MLGATEGEANAEEDEANGPVASPSWRREPAKADKDGGENEVRSSGMWIVVRPWAVSTMRRVSECGAETMEGGEG